MGYLGVEEQTVQSSQCVSKDKSCLVQPTIFSDVAPSVKVLLNLFKPECQNFALQDTGGGASIGDPHDIWPGVVDAYEGS